MKSFEQFRTDIKEVASDMSGLENTMKKFANQIQPKLKGIAKEVGKNVDTEKLKNTINTTVIDKLTGGEDGRAKLVKKVGDGFEKASNELPNAMNRFNDFLNSGTIEKKMNHLQSKFSNIANAGETKKRTMKKEIS